MSTPTPNATELAEQLEEEFVVSWVRGTKYAFCIDAAALLRTQAARIAELEAALAQQVPEPQPVNAPAELAGSVTEAMNRAFNLGQNYWQQADSDSFAQNRKSDATHAKFIEVRDRAAEYVRAAIAAADAAQAGSAQQVPAAPEGWHDTMARMVMGIDHLAEIARLWEPDYSTGADRRGWVLAKDARDDAMRLLAAAPLPTPTDNVGGNRPPSGGPG